MHTRTLPSQRSAFRNERVLFRLSRTCLTLFFSSLLLASGCTRFGFDRVGDELHPTPDLTQLDARFDGAVADSTLVTSETNADAITPVDSTLDSSAPTPDSTLDSIIVTPDTTLDLIIVTPDTTLDLIIVTPDTTLDSSTTPFEQWSVRLGSNLSDEGVAVDVDKNRNIALTGHFYNTVDFGGGPLTSDGRHDVFVASFDGKGVHRWSRSFGGTYTDWGMGVVIDDSGNTTVTGKVMVTVDFGAGPDVGPILRSDGFVASYGPTGLYRWSRRLISAAGDAVFGNDITTDGENVYFVGDFENAVDFGAGALMSIGGRDSIMVKYDSEGVHLLSKQSGALGSIVNCNGLAVDSAGNITFAGEFSGTVDFGGGPLTSAGTGDVYVASYAPSGAHRWSRRFGGTLLDYATAVAADPSGNVTVTGRFRETVDFGDSSPVTAVAGSPDCFVVSYDVNGAYRWSRHFGGALYDNSMAVAADQNGDVTVTGYFQDSADLGGGVLTSAGLEDVFVARYDSSGAHLWSKRFGAAESDVGQGVAVDGSGNVTLTGYFEETVDFGFGPLTSAGAFDVFLV
ncbi:MAG: hypothetical protein JRH20_28975, partial [Deltaproteobacteria bacterium]|nr:hypothetical protein [Deltaproteobacteria bacterium]